MPEILKQLTVRNYLPAPVECVVSLKAEADFADLFEVKEARIQRRWHETRQADGGALTIRAAWEYVQNGVAVQAPGADITPEALM